MHYTVPLRPSVLPDLHLIPLAEYSAIHLPEHSAVPLAGISAVTLPDYLVAPLAVTLAVSPSDFMSVIPFAVVSPVYDRSGTSIIEKHLFFQCLVDSFPYQLPLADGYQYVKYISAIVYRESVQMIHTLLTHLASQSVAMDLLI